MGAAGAAALMMDSEGGCCSYGTRTFRSSMVIAAARMVPSSASAPRRTNTSDFDFGANPACSGGACCVCLPAVRNSARPTKLSPSLGWRLLVVESAQQMAAKNGSMCLKNSHRRYGQQLFWFRRGPEWRWSGRFIASACATMLIVAAGSRFPEANPLDGNSDAIAIWGTAAAAPGALDRVAGMIKKTVY